MRTLADRLEWIIKTKFGGNASEMSRRCGFKNRNQIGMILARQRQDPSTNIGHVLLGKIAEAGGVTADWLITGNGPVPASTSTVEFDEKYPNRTRAIAAARALGNVSEQAISWVMAAPWSIDLSPNEWLQEMQAATRRAGNSAEHVDELRGHPSPTAHGEDLRQEIDRLKAQLEELQAGRRSVGAQDATPEAPSERKKSARAK
jgi:hypothetical protein